MTSHVSKCMQMHACINGDVRRMRGDEERKEEKRRKIRKKEKEDREKKEENEGVSRSE